LPALRTIPFLHENGLAHLWASLYVGTGMDLLLATCSDTVPAYVTGVLAYGQREGANRSVGEPLLSIDKHRDGQLDRQSEYIMNGFKEIDRYSEVGVCAVRSIDTGM